MYVTRPLSHYLKNPDSLRTPPEGPNSGYLIIQDEESETSCCFGLCKNRSLLNLPFPQNKELTLRYEQSSGDNTYVSVNPVFLIPVLNQAASSNRYYAIKPHGKHKGEAYTCSREEDMSTCCFCRCIKDLKPRQLDPNNSYQQIEICPYENLCTSSGSFFAKSVGPDGFPPYFLRRKGWSIYTKTPKHFKLDEALGLNSERRARLPEFNFPLSCKSSEAISVGKWYCPFVFIKDGTLEDQLQRSTYYELTLEQRWEQIFTCKNEKNQGNSVLIDVPIENEEVFVNGNKAVWNENNVVDSVMWFKSFHNGVETSIGLRMEIIQRMKWEQNRSGWYDGENQQVRINRVEEFKESWGWKEFGCYALVERFVLKRMDGSLVMTYSFFHTHQLKCKWE
ncbi:Hypothetical predicted protein [Olea europaea subsp. europaea]|uniref:Uncharacterized protein n=1 Tax=Olea europaea subsp. europaea TaxID=158383 RepID=A0A8S0RE30_OLEEU|nr:Hypothetical predicted protein [Olea europaea subsp. europaea]